jgi:hypothetical protein
MQSACFNGEIASSQHNRIAEKKSRLPTLELLGGRENAREK